MLAVSRLVRVGHSRGITYITRMDLGYTSEKSPVDRELLSCTYRIAISRVHVHLINTSIWYMLLVSEIFTILISRNNSPFSLVCLSITFIRSSPTLGLDHNRTGPWLDKLAQVSHRNLKWKLNRFEGQGEEYPPACCAAHKATCSRGLKTQLVSLRRDPQKALLSPSRY